ncbi:MAG: hypothetical protein JOZ80_15515 [Acidobacteriaceae bacterium]|nr:hypothetical protein [Acidobacteriaceae bacterium]
MNSGEFQALTQKVDELVQQVTALPESEARTAALELLQSVMDLHGAGMARIVEILSGTDDPGRSSLDKLGADPIVCGLLVLYGIHPIPADQRVRCAIESLAPPLKKLGATAEFLGFKDGAVRLKIHTDAQISSQDKLRATIEQAILAAAPEVTDIAIEGLTSASFVPLNMIQPAIKEEKAYEESPA